MPSEDDAGLEPGTDHDSPDDEDEIVISDDEIENPVSVSCPDCGATGDVPSWFIGNEMECKTCDCRFTVQPIKTEEKDAE